MRREDKILQFLILLNSKNISTYEEFCFLGYNAVESGKQLSKFLKNSSASMFSVILLSSTL
jgi:hypothetical protein